MKFIFTFQQISQNCPKDFLESEQFAYSTIELCLGYLFKILHRCALKEIFGSCVQFCFKSCREKYTALHLETTLTKIPSFMFQT